jgi:hypothetical protein
MQKTIENGVTVLTAGAGMVLANGSAFGSVVRLGKEADETAWVEMREEDAEKLIAENSLGEIDATEEDYQAALSEFGVKV